MPDPSPRDVVMAALVVQSPPQGLDPRPDLEWRADLIVHALDQAGLLVKPPPQQRTEADLIEIAKWLAEQSRHPRYVVPAQDGYPAGWERLYGPGASTNDVSVAYTAAARGVLNAETIQALQNARDTLTDALR